MPHIDQIVAFFLNLFKLQCRDPDIDESACLFEHVPDESEIEPVYDLRVKCMDGWKTRRMSIRQLGEQVESKSTCYKIIYDDQMVVKIPPSPIKDFKKYLEHIKNERHVSFQLAPYVKCVSPTLSAILSKIPGLIDDDQLSDSAMEEQYIRLLAKNPRFQNYLKIGETFVFFMNLSKTPFFNQAIDQIHEEKTRVQKEIIKNTWLFDSLEAFEAVYGDDRHDVFFNVNGLYKKFESGIDELQTKFKIVHTLPDYKKKEWFFSLLAREKPDIDENVFSENFTDAAQEIIKGIMITGQKTVNNYRKTVKEFVRTKIFENNKKSIEGLTINVLNLIYQLKDRSIAVRDLKPDNIYLSAKVDGATYQFWDHEAYSLGLIDLETAIDFTPVEASELNQPLLAGTPSYMTPTHIFRNSLLKSVFGGDIHRILYMQDMFAAISMIYNVVTGKMLFVKSAKLIPQIMKMKKKALFYKKPLPKVFKRVSSGFWVMAEEEFYVKLNANKDKFESVLLTLPKPVSDMLQEELSHEKKILQKSMHAFINSNDLLKEHESELINMSLFELSQFKALWGHDVFESDISEVDGQKFDKALKMLEYLKAHMENQERMRMLLGKTIVCYELMDFLFNRIMLAMYRYTWSGKKPSGSATKYLMT